MDRNVTSLPVDDQVDVALLRAVFLVLSKYIWSIPVTMGIPGNILAILVANRQHNRKLSPCVFMTAMAVADTVFLLEVLWFYSLYYPGHLDASFNKWARGMILTFHIFVIYTSGTISGLYLAAMSIDRVIAVRFPMAAVRLCTTTRARVVVINLTIPILVINVHLFFVYQYVEDLQSGLRMLVYDVPVALENASSFYSIITGTVLPFLVILGSNSIIIATLKKASRERFKLGTAIDQKGTAKSHNLTAMLLFVSAAYIATTLPYRLYHPIMTIPQVAAVYDITQEYWRLRSGIGIFLVAVVWMCNYATNFFLYCIGGGRRYRQDTKEVIGSLLKCALNDKL